MKFARAAALLLISGSAVGHMALRKPGAAISKPIAAHAPINRLPLRIPNRKISSVTVRAQSDREPALDDIQTAFRKYRSFRNEMREGIEASGISPAYSIDQVREYPIFVDWLYSWLERLGAQFMVHLFVDHRPIPGKRAFFSVFLDTYHKNGLVEKIEFDEQLFALFLKIMYDSSIFFPMPTPLPALFFHNANMPTTAQRMGQSRTSPSAFTHFHQEIAALSLHTARSLEGVILEVSSKRNFGSQEAAEFLHEYFTTKFRPGLLKLALARYNNPDFLRKVIIDGPSLKVRTEKLAFVIEIILKTHFFHPSQLIEDNVDALMEDISRHINIVQSYHRFIEDRDAGEGKDKYRTVEEYFGGAVREWMISRYGTRLAQFMNGKSTNQEFFKEFFMITRSGDLRFDSTKAHDLIKQIDRQRVIDSHPRAVMALLRRYISEKIALLGRLSTVGTDIKAELMISVRWWLEKKYGPEVVDDYFQPEPLVWYFDEFFQVFTIDEKSVRIELDLKEELIENFQKKSRKAT